jgi:hypothetical protein
MLCLSSFFGRNGMIDSFVHNKQWQVTIHDYSLQTLLPYPNYKRALLIKPKGAKLTTQQINLYLETSNIKNTDKC